MATSFRRIIPSEVKGFWIRRKTAVQTLLVGFFLALPWIKVNGQPMLLLDVVNKKFSIFGILFRAHDVPILFLFVMIFLFAFAFLTAAFGRVWCGWGCPQTVFIEMIFRRVERMIEGNSFEQRKNFGVTSFDVIAKKAVKWAIFTAVSILISHSFLALFVGESEMWKMIAAGPTESPGAFGFVSVVTLILLFDFGWFREQFCIYMCPYGRIQSVLQDRETITVSYDVNRGEPRGKIRSVTGDCVDCGKCVAACPTGIDIRNSSSQLECIACTACMDACDGVMTQIDRKPGLIRYASEANLSENRKPKVLRARTVLYFTALLGAIGLLLGVVVHRESAMIEIFKSRGAPFILLDDDDRGRPFANLFMAEMSNQTEEELWIEFKLVGGNANAITLIMPNNPISIPPGEVLKNPFTVRFSKSLMNFGKGSATLTIMTNSKIKREETKRS